MKEMFPTFARAAEFTLELLSIEVRWLLPLLDPRFWWRVYHG